ncbi:MAG TPA: WD40 repeat domain-containing protein [Euzebyales bacterium]
MSWEPVTSRRDVLRWSVAAAVVVVLLTAVVLGVRGWRNRSVSHAPGDGRATANVAWGGEPPPHMPGEFTVRRWPAATAEPVPAEEALRVEGAGGRTLVIADPLSLYEVDLATGAVRRLRLSDGAWGPLTEPLMTVGGDVITTTSEGVLRIPSRAHVERIAVDDRAVVTTDDRSVWVFDNLSTPLGGIVTRVRLSGGVADRLSVPDVTRPLAGTSDRIVVGGPGTVAVMGTDGTRRVLADGDPVASDGTRVAWIDCTEDQPCALVLGSVDDPDQVRLTLAADDLPGGVFGLPAGAFSPDGRWLAVPLTPAPGPVDGGPRSRVLVVDTSTGVEVRRLAGAYGPPTPIAWSPDGRWLAFATRSGLRLWDAERDEVRSLPTVTQRIRGLTFR